MTNTSTLTPHGEREQERLNKVMSLPTRGPEPQKLGALAAEAMIKESQAAIAHIQELGKSLDTALTSMWQQSDGDMDKLRERVRELDDLVKRAHEIVALVSAAQSEFGKEMSGKVALAGELCRRVISTCETLNRELAGEKP